MIFYYTMKSKLLLIIPLFLSLPCAFAGNPFLSMMGKPYAEYMMELKYIYYKLDYIEQSQADSLMAFMEEAATTANNRNWQAELEIFRMAYRFRYNTRIAENPTYTIAHAIEDSKGICDKANATNDTIIYLRALRGLMNIYVLDKEYDKAFETIRGLDRELNAVSSSHLPEKLLAYREMGELHYKFRNYPEAETFFRKITEDANAICYSLLRPAYNTLGLIYRYHYKDLQASDEYFRKILTVPNHENSSEEHCLAWEAIAKGNLGANLHGQGKYDEAIPLLEFSRKTMVGINDYTYAGGMVALLADIYLEKKNLVQCKRYIDQGVDYIRRSYPNQRWERLYPVMAKYYAITGNTVLSAAYQDSALTYQKKVFQEYDALKLLYAEQQANRLEQQTKNDELQIERMQTVYYKRAIFYVGIILLIIVGLLLYAVTLYRRKRVAYRELVKKSQEWASGQKTPMKSEEIAAPIIEPNEAELTLMERIQKLMDEEKVYLDPHFTLTGIVTQLGVNRTYISTTLNRCTGKTFTQYINEYRISEAINMMSVKENQYITIDNIAYNSGFSDRRTFHRIFKKITGLTPAEFRTNLPETSVHDATKRIVQCGE